MRQSNPWRAVAVLAFVAVAALVPCVVGYATDSELAYYGGYNRLGNAFLFLTLVWILMPVNRSWPQALLVTYLLVMLLATKVTFFAAGIAILLVYGVLTPFIRPLLLKSLLMLLAVLVVMFGSLPTLFKRSDIYTIRFVDAPGVGQGTPVRRSGVRIGEVKNFQLDDEILASHGTSLGCGVLAVLPAASCGVAESARILRYLAEESAGQCGPCVFGLPALAAATSRLGDPACGAGQVEQLCRWEAQIDGRGGCRHPDGAVRLLRSALDVFADDVSEHLAGRPCAGAAGTS